MRGDPSQKKKEEKKTMKDLAHLLNNTEKKTI